LACLMLGPTERRQQPSTEGDPVRLNQEELDYTVFPNPADEQLFVKSNQLIGGAKVELLDLSGRLLKSLNWSDRGDVLTIELNELKPGSYFVRVKSDYAAQTLRFVKL